IHALHNDPLAGHLGGEVTLQRIKERYYWEEMEKDILKHVFNCHCRLNKPYGAKKKISLQPLPLYKPFEKWELDFIGELPASTKGTTKYTYVLNMVDCATKWVELCACPDKSMETAAHKFEKRVVKRWGPPREVLTDRAFAGE